MSHPSWRRAHFLVVVDGGDDIYIDHPGCPEVLHHWATEEHQLWTVDCPYEEQIEACGIEESFNGDFGVWPPADGRYEIEFWSEKWYVPWSGYEYSAGLRRVVDLSVSE